MPFAIELVTCGEVKRVEELGNVITKKPESSVVSVIQVYTASPEANLNLSARNHSFSASTQNSPFLACGTALANSIVPDKSRVSNAHVLHPVLRAHILCLQLLRLMEK